MSIRKMAIASVSVAAVILTGCAGTGTSAPSSSSKDSGKVTLDFWSNHPAGSKALEQELIKRFEAANPDIHVLSLLHI